MGVLDWSTTYTENKTIPASGDQPEIEIGKAVHSPQGHDIQRQAIQVLMAEMRGLSASDMPVPEDFPDSGNVGDGSDDDGPLQACIDYCKANGLFMRLRNGVTYRTALGISAGTLTGEGALPGIDMRGATISAICAGRHALSLVGIQNSGTVQIIGGTVTGDETEMPAALLMCARPKQDSGVISSGRALVLGTKFNGYSQVAGYCVASETLTLIKPTFENSYADGHPFVLTAYDFLDLGGPNFPNGIEQDSTSTVFTGLEMWCNSKNAAATKPPMMIRGWGMGEIRGGLLNTNNAAIDLCAIMPADDSDDGDGDTGDGRNTYQLNITGVCMHGSHRNGFALGNADLPGGSLKQLRITGNGFSGNPSGSDIAVVDDTLQVISCTLHADESIDMGAADCRGMMDVEVSENLGSSITASGVLEGEWRGLSSTTWTIGTSAAEFRCIMREMDTGMVAYPARSTVTIDSGVVTIDRPFHLIDTEGAAASDSFHTITTESGFIPDGFVVTFRCASAARVPTALTTGGNIRGMGRVVMDSTSFLVQFHYDKASGHWRPTNIPFNLFASEGDGFTAMTGTAAKGALASYDSSSATSGYSATGATSDYTAGYTAPDISASYTESEVQAIADALGTTDAGLQTLDDEVAAIASAVETLDDETAAIAASLEAVSERMKAYDDALIAMGLLRT